MGLCPQGFAPADESLPPAHTNRSRTKDLSTPIIDGARARRDEMDRAIEAEMARSEHWWQWRHLWNKFCCWRFYRSQS
jgi:hypothetical protein